MPRVPSIPPWALAGNQVNVGEVRPFGGSSAVSGLCRMLSVGWLVIGWDKWRGHAAENVAGSQEGLTNCGRHSDARHITVDIKTREHELQLLVRDDGVGLNPAQRGGGLGLIGIDERV